MHLLTLALDLFDDYGGPISVSRLNERDRRALTAALYRDEPAVLLDVLTDIDSVMIAEHVADLVSTEETFAGISKLGKDAICYEIRDKAFGNETVDHLIQQRLDDYWERRRELVA